MCACVCVCVGDLARGASILCNMRRGEIWGMGSCMLPILRVREQGTYWNSGASENILVWAGGAGKNNASYVFELREYWWEKGERGSILRFTGGGGGGLIARFAELKLCLCC